MKQLSTVSQGWRMARMIRASGKSLRIRGSRKRLSGFLSTSLCSGPQIDLFAHAIPIACADTVQLFGAQFSELSGITNAAFIDGIVGLLQKRLLIHRLQERMRVERLFKQSRPGAWKTHNKYGVAFRRRRARLLPRGDICGVRSRCRPAPSWRTHRQEFFR